MLIGKTTEEKIWNFLLAHFNNKYGTAGMMGNLACESGLKSNNLQNSFEIGHPKSLGYTDETYTAAIDNGNYSKDSFINDKAGYGLAQWTYWSRKEKLYNFMKGKKLSIGDLEGQLNYLIEELTLSYGTVLSTLKNAKSVTEASNAVLLGFEKPKNQSEENQARRAKRCQEYYDEFAGTAIPSPVTPIPETAFSISQILFTNSDCYKENKKMTPQGIVVHSTGCNNPYIKRYVQPDDGIIGTNTNHNDWNRPGVGKCVSAFVGKDKDGNVTGRQTLPWDVCTWGCGRGKKGSYNYPPSKKYPNDIPCIQFEICEDDLTDKDYFDKAFNYAAELCAYLCKLHNISVDMIVSHGEANVQQMASSHIDPHNWMSKFGKDMNWFRQLVKVKLGSVVPVPTPTPTPTPEPTPTPVNYTAIVNTDTLNIRKGPGTNYPIIGIAKQGDILTIVGESDNWCKISNNKGWVCGDYLTKTDGYRVKINTAVLNIRSGPGTNYPIVGQVKQGGVYTIIEEQAGWGRLKSGAGWICLEYTIKL